MLENREVNMRQETTIVQSGGAWPNNIGNAFIDLGSMYTIKKALKGSNVVLSSSFPKCFLSKGALSEPVRILDGSIIDRTSNVFDVREAIKADYVVFSGALLNEKWLKICCFLEKLLKTNNDIKIIINGGGGSSYTEREIEIVRDYLNKINLYAFISRDEKAFKIYKGIAEHSFNGIDCAFFVNDYFNPPNLDLPSYITLTFDKIREPKLNNEKRTIIRTHHWCWSESGFLKKVHYKGSFNKKNTLISDLPQDYLTIYSNTEKTYSDRVHACVPTLAFGKPAKLYTDSLRALLFDKVNAGSIKNQLTYPDTKKIEKEKERQIRFLSEILE